MRFAFIGGARKSGTTWLLRMLAAHPEALAMGEGFFVGVAPWGLVPCVDRGWFNGWATLDNVAGSWLKGTTPDEAFRIAKRGMVEALIRNGAARSGKAGFRVVIDKTAYASNVFCEELHSLFPEACFIDIVRDGRDCAVSDMFMYLRVSRPEQQPEGSREFLAAAKEHWIEGGAKPGAPMPLFDEWSIRRCARDWAESVRGGFKAERLFGPRYLRLRYEEMLGDGGEAGVRAALRLLGIDGSDERVKACVEAGSFESLSGGRRRGEEDRSSFFRKGGTGDWRAHFTERDRQIFREETGDLLARLGYGEGEVGW